MKYCIVFYKSIKWYGLDYFRNTTRNIYFSPCSSGRRGGQRRLKCNDVTVQYMKKNQFQEDECPLSEEKDDYMENKRKIKKKENTRLTKKM